MSLTWSSNLRILPGFTRTAPQPASIAWNTYFGLKWMSAITGMRDCLAMIGSASASLSVGQATRTMSQPAAVSSAICWSVAPISCVFVVVMDWTDTGAPPPTGTSPTISRCVCLRGNGDVATEGIPRLISLTRPLSRTRAHPSYTGAAHVVRLAFRRPRALPSRHARGHSESGYQPREMGFTMSATMRMTLIATSRPPTAHVRGTRRAVSAGPGSSLPRRRANCLRTPS